MDRGPGDLLLGDEAEFEGVEKPFDWEAVKAGENLDGLSEAQHVSIRERAVPEPAGLLRDDHEFSNDARRDIPSTIIATGYTSD